MRLFKWLLIETILCGSSTAQVQQSRRKYVPVGSMAASMPPKLCSTCTSLLRSGFRVVGVVLVGSFSSITKSTAVRQSLKDSYALQYTEVLK